MKFCKDCIHYSALSGHSVDVCKHPKMLNMVTGDATRACGIERYLGTQCGPQGKLFKSNKVPYAGPKHPLTVKFLKELAEIRKEQNP